MLRINADNAIIDIIISDFFGSIVQRPPGETDSLKFQG